MTATVVPPSSILQLLLLLTICTSGPVRPTSTTTTPVYRASIVKAWPHATTSFTEGFGFIPRSLLHEATMPVVYESTGLYTKNTSSSIRLSNYRTNSIILHRELPRGSFAEGSTLVGGVLFVGSLSSNQMFTFEATTLQPLPLSVVRLPPQGPLHSWGLTTDPSTDLLYVSDGSSEIHIVSINTQGESVHVGSINVHDGDTPIRELNELEFVEGLIYANILGRSCIAKILPETGDVVGWLSFEAALKKWPSVGTNEVLLRQMNGIAYDSFSKVLLVTGKLWPFVFEIQEGVPIIDGQSVKDTVACKPSREVDYKHAHLGLNNRLPLIPFPTAESVRKNYPEYTANSMLLHNVPSDGTAT
jgi:glutamine cyclotransferase